ncbi:hypothetical protein M2168_002250 [Streptomyces sp. CZ24]|nr:hypothetical protein [Streptomyces sp. CZ24]
MLAQRLQVADLEPGALQLGDGGADGGEFAVGEDVGVDEGVHVVGGLVVLGAAGDLVIEEPSAGLEQGVQVVGVLQVPDGADVLGHADGGDRVVGPVPDVAVVLDADLDAVGEALFGGALAGVGGLFAREGDADDLDAVLAGGVQRHRAPAAADVEQAHAGGEAELAADQVELVALGALQGGVVLPVGARVDHGGAEDPLVEVVADVVVVADGLAVAALGVPAAEAAPDGGLLGRGRRREEGSGQPGDVEGGGAHLRVPDGVEGAEWGTFGLPDHSGEEVERLVEVPLDGEVAGDPGPHEAEFTGLEEDAAQGAAVAEDDHGGSGRTVFGAVPGAQADREGDSQYLFGVCGQPLGGTVHDASPSGFGVPELLCRGSAARGRGRCCTYTCEHRWGARAVPVPGKESAKYMQRPSIWHAKRGRSHHGWRAPPQGAFSVRSGRQDALALADSDSSALAAGAGVGLAAS